MSSSADKKTLHVKSGYLRRERRLANPPHAERPLRQVWTASPTPQPTPTGEPSSYPPVDFPRKPK